MTAKDIIVAMQTDSTNYYYKGSTIKPVGIVVHSTGANNPTARRYVNAPMQLGANPNGNWFGSPKGAGGDPTALPHRVIGLGKDDKTVVVCQILPWTAHCQGCGSGRYGSYWTNIPNVTQPADKGIMLADIIDNAGAWTGKSYCLTANYAGATLKNTLERHQRTMVAEPVRIGDIGSSGQAHRVYSVHGKSIALSTGQGGQGSGTGLYKIDLPDGDYIIRKLSPVECERLQTLPDGYTDCISNTQRYKCLGNGWTVDVISHILHFLPNI